MTDDHKLDGAHGAALTDAEIVKQLRDIVHAAYNTLQGAQRAQLVQPVEAEALDQALQATGHEDTHVWLQQVVDPLIKRLSEPKPDNGMNTFWPFGDDHD